MLSAGLVDPHRQRLSDRLLLSSYVLLQEKVHPPTGMVAFSLEGACDASNPRCPLTTLQPAEILYVSYRETHT